MQEESYKKPFYKRKFFSVTAIIVAVIAVLHFYSPFLIVFPTQLSFDATETVRIKAYLLNISFFPKHVFWNTCGEHYSLHVDGKKIYPKTEISVGCMIGSNFMPPFAIFGNKEYLINHAELTSGSHYFHATSNNKRSNSIFFRLTKDGTIGDCYSYTKDITPQCKQLLIHTNVWEADHSENNKRCVKIKKALIENTQLRPIEKLSTTNCDSGDPAYFVLNVPPEDFPSWQAKLADQNELEIFTAMTEYEQVETK